MSSEDKDHSVHEYRLAHGCVSILILGVVAFITLLTYETVTEYPHEVLTTVAGIIGLCVGTYVLGYLTYDLPQHVREWLDDDT